MTNRPTDLQDSRNRAARDRAVAGLGDLGTGVTGLVDYSAGRRLLVIASGADDLQRLALNGTGLEPAALILGAGRDPVPGITTWHAERAAIELGGWLGAFHLRLPEHGSGEGRFDLVLDLGETPLLDADLAPPGYLRPGRDQSHWADALRKLGGLVGEFKKPRFFGYNPNLCAHGMKGRTACTRCIDACPAGAIESLVDRVRVEPHLCQGGGACATVCPSGAMTYEYPSVEDLLTRVRRLLAGYRDAGGANPVLLIHDSEAGVASAAELTEAHGNLLPMVVEEVASLGQEGWLSALAYGARAVRLVDSTQVPERSRHAVDEQLAISRALLGALGLPSQALGWSSETPEIAASAMPPIAPATHAAVGTKRQHLFAAVDHLYTQATRPHPLVSLPAGAPFGTAEVSDSACTLCLACVTVCPGKALMDGQDVPQLRFVESNCLQCGLCTRACPEDAIWITPRFLFDATARAKPRLLREDQPFLCPSCGKAFATMSVIGRMQQRLADHPMFTDPEALARLRLCGDCRVTDMMRAHAL